MGFYLLAAGGMASLFAQGVPRGKAWASVSAGGQLQSGFNSTGSQNSVVRNSAGNYTVTYKGLGTAVANGSGGMSHVVSGDPLARCHSGTYNVSGSDIAQTVLCTDHTGSPRDSAFTGLYYRESGVSANRFDAYAWNDQNTPAAPTRLRARVRESTR